MSGRVFYQSKMWLVLKKDIVKFGCVYFEIYANISIRLSRVIQGFFNW